MDQHPQHSEQKTNGPSTGVKITVLVILIALLAAGILLPIKIIPNAFSSIGSSISSFFKGNESQKLSVDRSTINSGEQFTLSWDGSHRTDGTYALTYECGTGLRLETSINQPNEAITCGNTFYFAPNENAINLTAITASTQFTDLKMDLGFLQNGASTVDTIGNITVTVTNNNLPEALTPSTATTTPKPATPVVVKPVTPKPKPKPVITPTKPVSNPNGIADLEVRAVATGYLTDTGIFIPSATVTSNRQAAIKFQVVNVGNKNTGTWTFTVDLPSETDPRYVSGNQQNLGPGDRIEYVLGFSNVLHIQNNIATVSVDPLNFIRERSETNNIVRMSITNGDYGTQNGKADLTIRMLDTGIVNRSTGTYTIATRATSGDRVAARFEVTNNGTIPTGVWRFQATLPTSDTNNQLFLSDTLPSLNPGEKRTYTVGFENLQNVGTNTITITVDSANQVSETNENNTASISINRN
jgi:hypothetical protein